MAKNSDYCGPKATDNYYEFRVGKRSGKEYSYRSHTISGEGVVTSCAARDFSDEEVTYKISYGITELGDGCLSKSSIYDITLPTTLEVIGNSCFKKTKISSITLPPSLKKIGHTNFPCTLTALTIPALIQEFFVDNVYLCDELTSIYVDEKNENYKSVDGILYNYDMTEILFCPNAKTGKVIIPNTVKRIGDYCFCRCKFLKAIIIPPTVEYIGKYAFWNSSLEKLVVPNSVKAIGSGCFMNTDIAESLKLSTQISVLPESCFTDANIKKLLFSFSHITEIGNHAIGNQKNDILSSVVSFESLQLLGVSALNNCSEADTFEFFSKLTRIEEGAFSNTWDNVNIRYFSSCPIRLPMNAFQGLSDNATLVVPKGSKIIFQNAAPWSVIANIREWNLDIDYNDNGEEVLCTDEVHLKRLKSVAESKINADRYYLKEVIEDILLNYLYVDSDDEYDEALEVIKYNRSFSLAIVPDLERRMCQNWTNKYKIKLASTSVLDNPALLGTMLNEAPITALPTADSLMLPNIEITSVLEEPTPLSVQVIFNDDIQKQLQSILTLAKKSLKIAVSWFTNYSLFKQVKEIATSGVNVQLVTNNDLTNNGGYCLNFNELLEAGVEISLIEYPHLLHHKFCIIDDNIVVNGSYNWTRFSAKNYENITIIRNDFDAIDAFADEFDKLLQSAEHKCIKEMPDFVPERPEYDRGAFRQYVTEELDAEARETPLERDKIIALQKAATLNSDYLEKINPEAKKAYADAFKAVAESNSMKNTIASIVEDKPISPQVPTNVSSITGHTNNTIKEHDTSKASAPMLATAVSRATQQKIEKVKASNLFMVLDVSASMSNTYDAGHVHSISKKALAASLAITDSKEVSLWTFGENAHFIANVGIDSISKINDVRSKNENTYLMKFVQAANSSIEDGALVIIFTDDDPCSISNAVSAMQERSKVFWQIIVYGGPFDNITKSISNVANTSVVSLTDYASKTDEQISELLLKDYIVWKKRQ